MLTVTGRACSKLRELWENQSQAPAGIRIQVVGAGCSGFQYRMRFEKERNSDDEQMELNGICLMIDSSSWAHLNSTVLDYVESGGATGFRFIKSEQGKCSGCGGACK